MAIDTVVEEVASNLEEAAEATRRLNPKSISFVLGGFVVGLGVGFFIGYRFNKEKIKAEAFKKSEAEVEMIREVYQQKMMAAEPKPSVEEVIEEKGYDRPLPAPVPGIVEPESTDAGWDYRKELANRVDGEPYVIHQNEFMSRDSNYTHVAYTYYEGDDVLVDENNRPLPHADIIVGVNNLRFGVGTDDDDVVFVRNDRLERDMEICRTHDSYEEEVLGLENHQTNEDDDTD